MLFPTDPLDRLVVACAAGFGLALAGAVNLLFAAKGRATRAAVTAAACGAAVAGAAAWNADVRSVGPVAAVLAAGVVGGLLLNLRPMARWGVVAAVGVALAVGSVVAYDAAEQAEADRDAAFLDAQTSTPELAVSERYWAVTDRGTRIPLKWAVRPRPAALIESAERSVTANAQLLYQIIRNKPADDTANCHGWVFAAARFWIPGESVDAILRDNGYAEVAAPRPGDVVIYRDVTTRAVLHSAVVRYVADGMPTLVEGKWGALGVYLHPLDKCSYGTCFGFYRSPRPGHDLTVCGETAGPADPSAKADPPTVP